MLCKAMVVYQTATAQMMRQPQLIGQNKSTKEEEHRHHYERNRNSPLKFPKRSTSTVIIDREIVSRSKREYRACPQ